MAFKPRLLNSHSGYHSGNPATLTPCWQNFTPESVSTAVRVFSYSYHDLLPEHSGQNNHHCVKHITVPLLQLEQPETGMDTWVNGQIWLMTEKRNYQEVEKISPRHTSNPCEGEHL